MGDASNNIPHVPAAAANVVFLAVLLLGLPAVSLSGEKTTIATAAASGGKTREYVSYSFSSFVDSFRDTNLTVHKDAGIGPPTPSTRPLTCSTSPAASSSPSPSSSGTATTPMASTAATHPAPTPRTIRRPSKPASPSTSTVRIISSPARTSPSSSPPPSTRLPPAATAASLAFNGDRSNHLVAIELDIVKQRYDPDSNHVGLDVNGVISVATSSLTPFGIEISPVNATNYTVWIDYDGAARHVWVYMAVAGRPKPILAVLNASLDPAEVVLRHSYLGFSAATGTEHYQLNCVLAWNMTVEKLADDTGDGSGIMPRWKLGLVAGVPALTLALIVAGLLAAVYVRKIRKVGEDSSEITGTLIMSLAGSPREFPYKELKKATNNFDEKMKLGQGGFGTVYFSLNVLKLIRLAEGTD